MASIPSSRRVAPPCHLRRLECRASSASHPLWECMLDGPAARAVTAGFDALQKAQGDWPPGSLRMASAAVTPSMPDCTVLAGQPIGLQHPIQVDNVVERAQRRPRFRPRQVGYPLSVRGQVCGVQCPLPCVRSTVLYSWHPPSLCRVPASPVPRLHRYYEGATTSRTRVPAPLWFRSQAPRAPPVFVVAEALLMSSEEAHQAWNT